MIKQNLWSKFENPRNPRHLFENTGYGTLTLSKMADFYAFNIMEVNTNCSHHYNGFNTKICAAMLWNERLWFI